MEHSNQPSGKARTKKVSLSQRIRSSISRRFSSNETNEEITYGKMIVFGETGVGKTSLIHRFANNYFTEQYTPTLTTGVFEVTSVVQASKEFATRKESVSKIKRSLSGPENRSESIEGPKSLTRVLSIGSSVNVQKQEDFPRMKQFKFSLVDTTVDITTREPATYKAMLADAKGFLFVCSFDKPTSLEYLRNLYTDVKQMRGNSNVPLILIGNKSDLFSEPTVLTKNDVILLSGIFKLSLLCMLFKNFRGNSRAN